MIIVEKDNKGGDYFVEEVIATIPNPYYAKKIHKLMMEKMFHENDSSYFVLEQDDYILRIEPFEP